MRGIGTLVRVSQEFIHGFALICKCEKAFLKTSRHVQATGSPNGLSCGEREGWFISSFEREGSWVS